MKFNYVNNSEDIYIMSKQAEANFPSSQFDPLDKSMSSEQRQNEIDSLEALFKAEEFVREQPIPELSSLNLEEDTPAYTRRQKIRSYASEAGLYLAATDMTSRITTRLRNGRQARNEKYATKEGDSRYKRVKKFIGRNSIRLATGGIVGLTAGAVFGLKAEHAVQALTDPQIMPNQPDASRFESVQTMADTRYLVGGHLDDSGHGMEGVMNNLQGHGANNTVRIEYPADIAPIPGDSQTLDQSSQVASDKLYNAYKNSNGKSVEFIGYSEGTQGVQDAANRIAAENGGTLPSNVKVTLIATPNAANTGFFNSPYAQVAEPLLNSAGINIDRPIPKGAEVIAMDTDFWANSGDKPITTTISQLIGLAGDGHRPPSSDLNYTTNVVDGVTYKTYYHDQGPQTAALRVLDQQTDIPVTPAMDELGQAIAPQGEVGVGVGVAPQRVFGAMVSLGQEGLNDRGITQLDPMLDQIESINLGGGEQSPAAPLTDLLSGTSPAPANTAPAPTMPAEMTQTVDIMIDAAEPFIPPQAQPMVNDLQNNFNNFLNTLPK